MKNPDAATAWSEVSIMVALRGHIYTTYPDLPVEFVVINIFSKFFFSLLAVSYVATLSYIVTYQSLVGRERLAFRSKKSPVVTLPCLLWPMSSSACQPFADLFPNGYGHQFWMLLASLFSANKKYADQGKTKAWSRMGVFEVLQPSVAQGCAQKAPR